MESPPLTNVSVESTTYDEAKTSFKTKDKNIDDEATRRFVEILKQTERELTGKNSLNSANWAKLAELLATELKIAAARTTVSNVPAFLTEHLRRRLWKVDENKAIEIAVAPEAGSTSSLSEDERRKCPDCAGTNFWYPEGPERGVARCVHRRLRSEKPEQVS
ncbi:MAG: hypothetical protein ACR2G4_11670 [Pyrinomonadaceae bacterium]